jgi:ABC-2 type transport system permease protein
MAHVRAVIAALVQQWKMTVTGVSSLIMYVSYLPMVGVFAWIADRNADSSVLTYLLVGAPLMVIWNGSIFQIGWSLNSELFGRTLEFVTMSKTPMIIVLLGKALAQILFGFPAAAVAFGMILVIARTPPHVNNMGLLLVSSLFVITSITIISLLFAPVNVLVGGRAGFFNPIIPFGAVLSGFLFPVDRLPGPLQLVARLLPTSWAMDGIRHSVEGTESLWPVATSWLVCGLLTVVWAGLTYFLFRVIEKRIRITGVLGAY